MIETIKQCCAIDSSTRDPETGEPTRRYSFSVSDVARWLQISMRDAKKVCLNVYNDVKAQRNASVEIAYIGRGTENDSFAYHVCDKNCVYHCKSQDSSS